MARFLFGVVVGVGATLAWQSYGDQAKEIVVPWAAEKVMTHAPSLAWLVPSWTKGPSQIDTAAKQTSPPATRQVPDAAVVQPAAVFQGTSALPTGGAPAELARQLAAMERDLAMLRHSVEQMQAELKQKLAFPPMPPFDQNAPWVALPQPAPRPPAAPAR